MERQQLKWFATAGLILVAVPVANTMSPFGFDSDRLIELLSTWPLYVAIGIAILRYRLYDIDRLLNRTLVYGLLTVVLGLGYGAAVLVAGQLSGGLDGHPPELGDRRRHPGHDGPVPAGPPPRPGYGRPALQRRRYAAATTIQAFAARLRQQLDLDALTP